MVGISKSISAVLVAGFVVASGCTPSFDYTGRWVGKRKLEARPGEDPTIFTTKRKVELTVKDREVYVLVNGGLPSEGILDLHDKVAHFRPRTVMGQRIDRQPEATRDALASATIKVVDVNTITFDDGELPIAELRRESPAR